MKDTPYAHLLGRLDSMSNIVSKHVMSQRAGLSRSVFCNWQKGEAPIVLRWFELLRRNDIDPWSLAPESSTFQTLKDKIGSREKVMIAFMEADFHYHTFCRWETNGDPRHIEAIKRLHQELKMIEDKYEIA